MKRLNTSPVTSQIIHIEGIGVVKATVNKLKQLEGDASSMWTSAHDVLGGMLDVEKLRRFAEVMR